MSSRSEPKDVLEPVPSAVRKRVATRHYQPRHDDAGYERLKEELSRRGFYGTTLEALVKLSGLPRSAVLKTLEASASAEVESLAQSDRQTRVRHARLLEAFAQRAVDLAALCRSEPSLTEIKMLRAAVVMLQQSRWLTAHDDSAAPSAPVPASLEGSD